MKIGYVRVSTKEQNTRSQEKELIEAGCEEIFIDRISGVNVIKPEFEKMLRFARKGDCIVVTRLDRLGRKVVFLLDTVERIQKLELEFQSLHEQIDPATAQGRMMIGLMAVLSQYERESIKDRTERGRKAAQAKGIVTGRKKSLTREDIDAVYILIDGGKSTQAVADTFNVSKRTVQRYLSERRNKLNEAIGKSDDAKAA